MRGRSSTAQLGLGKASEYEAKADEATESRKAMTGADRRRGRGGEAAARGAGGAREGIREKLREETDVFYCEVCDKRYTKVMEFENHLSSYDHHHRKRFKEMREAERARAKASRQAPPKKEKKIPRSSLPKPPPPPQPQPQPQRRLCPARSAAAAV